MFTMVTRYGGRGTQKKGVPRAVVPWIKCFGEFLVLIAN